MKLFTRLIDSGIFIFWSTDGADTLYRLKINVLTSGLNVNILNFVPPDGQAFYSFGGIGSGDYEIVLDGFKGERLYQTETKLVKFVASAQRAEENLQRLERNLNSLSLDLSSIDRELSELASQLTDPREIAHRQKIVRSWFD